MALSEKIGIAGLLVALFVLLLGVGPSRVVLPSSGRRVFSGEDVEAGTGIPAERNFVRYTLSPKQQALTLPEARQKLEQRFGISVLAILNANGQRGSNTLRADRRHQVLIPLQPSRSR